MESPREALESGTFSEGFMTVKKEGFYVTLPPASLMRIHMELVRPQVFIRQCELVRQAGPQAFDSEFNLPIFQHEAQMWN